MLITNPKKQPIISKQVDRRSIMLKMERFAVKRSPNRKQAERSMERGFQTKKKSCESSNAWIGAKSIECLRPILRLKRSQVAKAVRIRVDVASTEDQRSRNGTGDHEDCVIR